LARDRTSIAASVRPTGSHGIDSDGGEEIAASTRRGGLYSVVGPGCGAWPKETDDTLECGRASPELRRPQGGSGRSTGCGRPSPGWPTSLVGIHPVASSTLNSGTGRAAGRIRAGSAPKNRIRGGREGQRGPGIEGPPTTPCLPSTRRDQGASLGASVWRGCRNVGLAVPPGDCDLLRERSTIVPRLGGYVAERRPRRDRLRRRSLQARIFFARHLVDEFKNDVQVVVHVPDSLRAGALPVARQIRIESPPARSGPERRFDWDHCPSMVTWATVEHHEGSTTTPGFVVYRNLWESTVDGIPSGSRS